MDSNYGRVIYFVRFDLLPRRGYRGNRYSLPSAKLKIQTVAIVSLWFSAFCISDAITRGTLSPTYPLSTLNNVFRILIHK